MNCKDTKSIDMVAFIQNLGYSGTVKGSDVWFCSPYRNEKTSSFRVDTQTNRFKDFRTGDSGDLIDLVKLMHNTDNQGALDILSGSGQLNSFSFSQANHEPVVKEPKIHIKKIQSIQNEALIKYLTFRKIPLSLAALYMDEAYYTVDSQKGSNFFALAFKNDKGGYELRNRYWKGCNSPKYLTSFSYNGSKHLNLFEGVFDFLSALVYHKTNYPVNTSIVLNSLSFLPDVIPMLVKYEKINLYLDNDPAGVEAVEKIRSLHPCTVDKSKIIYPLHKDFNEYLINTLNIS